MNKIPLTRGLIALVDDEDYDQLNRHKWCAKLDIRTSYCVRASKDENGRWFTQSMHRVIVSSMIGRKLGRWELVDHINGDGTDNRRINLRVVTAAQNCRNRYSRPSVTTSRFLGIYYSKRSRKWIARVRDNGVHVIIGRSVNEIDAAIMRDDFIAAHPELMARRNFATKDGGT
jgi:hypothetical protein